MSYRVSQLFALSNDSLFSKALLFFDLLFAKILNMRFKTKFFINSDTKQFNIFWTFYDFTINRHAKLVVIFYTRNISWNFSGFATIELTLNHSSVDLTSVFKWSRITSIELLLTEIVLSSAKLQILLLDIKNNKSFKNMLNSKGLVQNLGAHLTKPKATRLGMSQL